MHAAAKDALPILVNLSDLGIFARIFEEYCLPERNRQFSFLYFVNL